ncbi:MAG: hypothetical protein K2X87_08120 [Gemmataceae bacterium]|nr:hypothetical protein [Gemmataceae bacterium]
MEYDLFRLFDHPLRFRRYIPSAIVVLGGDRDAGRCEIGVEWRTSASGPVGGGTLGLSWDVATLRPFVAEVEEELLIARTRNRDRASQVEEAAVVVAVAVLAQIEPATRFTDWADLGTRHDFYLNDRPDEMIEVAGRWEGGLPGLFELKRGQSDQNAGLRKRWVSVTIMRETARNRTEGLHS